MIFAGSTFMLTCSVEVPTSVDIETIVNIEWIRDSGTVISAKNESLHATRFDYTFVANVDRARSGNYTCKATLRSMNRFITMTGNGTSSDQISITVGECN